MKTDQYYLAELEDKLLETVYNYVQGLKRPYGILISGGFDSGLLAALTKPDYVYSIRFPYGIKYDESRYADAIIDHLGLRDKTTIITITKEHFDENFRDAVTTMGEPVSHFSLVPLYTLFKTIRKDKGPNANILSGEGPDEYLGGYARQIIFDELRKLYEIPELRSYHGLINKVLNIKDPEYDFYYKYAELVGYSEEEIRDWKTAYGYDILKESGYPFQGGIGKMDMDLGVIEIMEQRLAKRHEVNLHYPYINEKFSDYCYTLPDNLKIRNGVTKWAFRQICKKYLPEFVMDRAKMGGPVAPINHWIDVADKGEFDKKRYLEIQKEILKLHEL